VISDPFRIRIEGSERVTLIDWHVHIFLILYLGGGGDFMLLAMAWMVMAAVMYLLRPSSMRGQGDAKPQGIAIFLFRTADLFLPTVACWFLGADRYSSKLSVRIIPYYRK
jgi:hypothetical protein